MVQNKVEGLLIHKMPYQERDLLGKVLLRNGHKLSVLFYGGQGGGKHHKVTGLELGNMLQIDLNHSKGISEIVTSREWSCLWQHRYIRDQHQAFYLLCLFAEIIARVSPDSNLTDSELEYAELFKVASNGVFYLDEALRQNQFNKEVHISFFLVKLLMSLGIFPDTTECCLCGNSLANDNVALSNEHGGFTCRTCSAESFDPLILVFVRNAVQTKYQYFSLLPVPNLRIARQLFKYFCHQFQLTENSFKSLSLVL